MGSFIAPTTDSSSTCRTGLSQRAAEIPDQRYGAMNAARTQVELLMNRLWQLDLAVSWVSPGTRLSSRSRSVDCVAEALGANPSLPEAPLVPLSLSRACQ